MSPEQLFGMASRFFGNKIEQLIQLLMCTGNERERSYWVDYIEQRVYMWVIDLGAPGGPLHRLHAPYGLLTEPPHSIFHQIPLVPSHMMTQDFVSYKRQY